MGPTRPASIAITVITTSNSMRVKPRSVRRDTQHLLHRRDLGLDLDPTVVPHGLHAFFRRELAQSGERFARRDRAVQVLGDDEELEDAGAAEIAGAATGVAAA